MTRPKRTLLTGASILDGTGAPARTGTVMLEDDRIASVEHPTGSVVDPTVEVIDLMGWTIAPGFIDMHSHSDLRLLVEPAHLAKVTQGVTTELLGQDGLSYAPVDDTTLHAVRHRIRGWNADPADFDFSWRDVDGYLARLAGDHIACNAGYLVPHGNVRELVMGQRTGPADSADLAAQCEIVRIGMQQGAFGMSAGLTYVPGMFAGTDELVELCRVVASYNGVYVPHHRNYGSDVLGGYAECFDIARRSGVRLHLAHTHLSFGENAHLIGQLLSMFEQAERDGVDFSFDSYPYAAAMSTLHAQFPSWSQVGSPDDIRHLFTDPGTRARIAEATDRHGSDGHSGMTVNWHTIVVADVPGVKEGDWGWTVGMNVADAAAITGQQPTEFAMDLTRETNFAASCLIFVGNEDNVRILMQHPRHTVGSDGILVGAQPHPRGWGSFARVLGHYVRELSILTLPEAIRHMTSAPAARLGLTDRGRIAPGTYADLVVFDPDMVGSQATYTEPRRPATGIRDVWCNGIRTLTDTTPTGARPGRALRAR